MHVYIHTVPRVQHVHSLLCNLVVVSGPGDLELHEGLVLFGHLAVEDVRVAQAECANLFLYAFVL